jgi:hypothetical protein
MILVIGESGTGKSTSLENLNPEETFIVQAIGKSLPFKGWRRSYKPYSIAEKTGNLLITDQSAVIISTLEVISKERTDIKVIIIDDFQYIMSNEFMRRVKEKGYDKFNDIGNSAWGIINKLNSMRSDLVPIVLSHSEQSESGKTKLKTLGKMLDDKVVLEGMFTIVLQTIVYDGKYLFMTQSNGANPCKSPRGLFESDTIPNDMAEAVNAYNQYNNADLEELKSDMLEDLDAATDVKELIPIFKRYPEFSGDSTIVELFATKKEKLTKAAEGYQHVPTGLDSTTYDKDLFAKCTADAMESEGRATDKAHVDRTKVNSMARRLYAEALAEKLTNEEK